MFVSDEMAKRIRAVHPSLGKMGDRELRETVASILVILAEREGFPRTAVVLHLLVGRRARRRAEIPSEIAEEIEKFSRLTRYEVRVVRSLFFAMGDRGRAIKLLNSPAEEKRRRYTARLIRWFLSDSFGRYAKLFWLLKARSLRIPQKRASSRRGAEEGC